MDIDKMKALALAATEGGEYFEMQSKLIDFQFEASPWAVLELIAEVERLRAALAGPKVAPEAAESRMDATFEGGPKIAAPAAGREKDAERRRAFRARRSYGDLSATDFVLQFDEDADAIIDAAIGARTKAGKGG